MSTSQLCLFILLSICFESARGDHEYSRSFEHRLNALENELENTKVNLVKTEHRLRETELKNKQLEMKLQRSIETFDSKYKELDDMIIDAHRSLKITNEKLKVTNAELRVTQEELKITRATPYKDNEMNRNLKSNGSGKNTTYSKPTYTDAYKMENTSKLELIHDGMKQSDQHIRDGFGSKFVNSNLTGSGKNLTNNIENTNIKVKRVDELGSVIAFHAELGPLKPRNSELGTRNSELTSVSLKPHLAPDATIKFETVTQNFGNAYDPQFGFFKCPSSGLYFFTFTIMTNVGKEIETKLVVNGSPIAYSYSAGPTAYHNAGSKSVITYLHRGDKVWIELYYHDGPNVFGGGIGWSTFTGFMIKET